MKAFVQLLISWGPAGVFVLAVLDSAGLPLPAAVDALLVATAVVNPAAAYLSAFLAILGSAIGSMVLYYIARQGGQSYLNRTAGHGLAIRARELFHTYGLITVFVPALVPLLPLPLKIPVICSGVFGVSPGGYLAAILAARIPRYFGMAWLGTRLGHDAMGWLKQHMWEIGLFAAALAAVLFFVAHKMAEPGRLEN